MWIVVAGWDDCRRRHRILPSEVGLSAVAVAGDGPHCPPVPNPSPLLHHSPADATCEKTEEIVAGEAENDQGTTDEDERLECHQRVDLQHVGALNYADRL